MYETRLQLNIPAQERLNEASIRDQMELNKLAVREQILNSAKLELSERKMQMQEYRRAVKSTNYTVVSISQIGVPKIEVKNDLITLPERSIANFRFDDIVELVSSDGEKGIYGLRISIEGTPIQVFLNAEKMGKPEYFMRKLTMVGGQILADKEKDRRNILISLWAELRRRCNQTLIVPVAAGWIKEETSYRFVKEGAVLWDQIIRRAK